MITETCSGANLVIGLVSGLGRAVQACAWFREVVQPCPRGEFAGYPPFRGTGGWSFPESVSAPGELSVFWWRVVV